jgi:hypothetical protein
MTAFDPTAKIGRVPCWALRFFDEAEGGGKGDEILVVDHDFHTAEIAVSLQGGLTAGRFVAKIGRLRADAFGKLAEKQIQSVDRGENGREGPKRIYVELAMWWANPMLPAGDFDDARVIETFRLTKMTREVEGLDVVTHIEGRRALYDRLSLMRTPTGDGIEAADTLAAVQAALEAAGLTAGEDFLVHPPLGAPVPAAQRLPPDKPMLTVLKKLRQQMIRQPPYRRGRPLYLIRGGKIHVGPWRPIPHHEAGGGGLLGAVVNAVVELFDAGLEKEMTAAVGLLTVKNAGTTAILGADETAVGDEPPERTNWELRAAGRQDIHPGDVLNFKKPSETAGLFGGFGLPSLPAGLGGDEDETVHLYVSDVAHKFSRNDGWITTVTGIQVSAGGDDAWDEVQTREGELPHDGDEADASTPAGRVARSVRRRIDHAFATRPISAIGEVRGHATETTEAMGVVQVAAQTTTVLRGILDLGGPRQARLDDIDRDLGDLQSNIPYATNFAWGPFGQVLPRYPGMRVMLLNHRSNDADPVEIGALWQTPDGEASRTPTNTQTGDWWLILPAYGDSAPPGPADGTDAVAPDTGLKASHDLIAASGERVIEVNGFTIRAFEAGSMNGPADRPAGAASDADKGGILIEQVDGGSTIKMLKDGTVEIVAGGDLSLSGENIMLIARSGTVDASNG